MATRTVMQPLDAKERYPRSAGKLMSWRLQQLRLDPEYMKICSASLYQGLERVCASCKSRRLCARDLAKGDVDSGMRSYCPNAPSIDALVVDWLT